MRFFWLVLIALALNYPCIAKEGNTLPAQRMVELASVRGEFHQERYISVLPLPLVSNGIFTYRKGSEMIWQTLAPVASTIRVTPGHGIQIIDAEGNPQEQASSQLLVDIFLGVFSGDLDSLSSLFKIAEVVDTDGWQLRLTPLDKSLSGYLQSILIIGSSYVESIQLTEGNGDRTEITLRVLDSTIDEPLPK